MHPANKVLIGVVSAALLSATALWEGTRYKAYYDLAGIPTVCQGYTNDLGKGDNPIDFKKTYSEQECAEYTSVELIETRRGVSNCINVRMKPNELDAFTLMAYNVGIQGFCTSRAAKLFNAGDRAAACKAMAWGPKNEPVWAYAGGKYVQGLHNRRKYEMAMCMGKPDANN